MSRYISVQGLEKQLSFTDTDLPLSIGEGRISDIPVQGCTGSAGHVGDSAGHLFFQPVLSAIPLFHNDCEITSSVWLKSGDNLRICSSFYTFTVSGDHYTFTHSDVDEQNSPADYNSRQQISPKSRSSFSTVNEPELPLAMSAPQNVLSKGKWVALCAVILSFLVVACLFILLARPVYLNITPNPDTLSMRGFPPAIALGNRFLGLPGSYTVVIEKEGYFAIEKEVEVKANGANHFTINLDKLPGKLLLNITPTAGVTIFIDDKQAGITPLDFLEIASGSHQVRLEKERYLPFKEETEIIGMLQMQELQATLAPAWSAVTFITDPAEADVFIGGEKKGTTPATIELLQGRHRVEIKKGGFITKEIVLESVAGQDQEINISLITSPATIMVHSVPSGISTMVNSEYKGVTPFSLELPSGKEQIFSLKTAGYAKIETSYLFQPEEQRALTFTLNPELGTVFFQVEPPTAALFINGKRQNNANGRFQLVAKQTQIEIKHPGYQSHSATLLPQKSYSQQFSITLKPQDQRVNPVAEPVKGSTTQAGKKMLLVTPSSFTMGAPRREAGRRANEHEHKVVLKRSFYASSHLVTNREFRQFRPNHSSGVVAGNSLDIDNHPVVNVTWKDAVLYCNWLSEREGVTPFYRIKGESVQPVSKKNNGFRLLTEAEWAYIARRDKRKANDRYPWSGMYPPRQLSGNYGDQSSNNLISLTISDYNDAFPVTSPVGSFPANPAGFFDLGGNAAEWCHDYYTAYSNTRETDPTGPPTGTLNVIRGSGWRDSSVAELRLSYRGYHKKAQDDVGFRIARYAQ